ncbi:MAG: TetR/AcrR family transcriptional regulator [Sulfitobacter sp.]
MNKARVTQEKLVTHAREFIWRYGYSNVSLRQITTAAGVDVALVSRYFGGKQGLFEATLDGAFDLPHVSSPAELVDLTVALFTDHTHDRGTVSILHLLLMNAQDEEVGALVRDRQNDQLQSVLETILGAPTPAALFMSVILGVGIAEKTLHLGGLAPHDSPEYEHQLRYMLEAAIAYKS